jgi:hypothetical protein
MRFLVFLTLLATNPAFSKTLILECAVTGQVSITHARADAPADPPDTKLDPATLQVEVAEVGTTLSVEIDGPSEYELLITSVPSEDNKVKAALASADSYVLNAIKSYGNFTIESSVIINRKSGAFSVLKTLVGPADDRYYKQTSYSGTCNKTNRTTNKF